LRGFFWRFREAGNQTGLIRNPAISACAISADPQAPVGANCRPLRLSVA